MGIFRDAQLAHQVIIDSAEPGALYDMLYQAMDGDDRSWLMVNQPNIHLRPARSNHISIDCAFDEDRKNLIDMLCELADVLSDHVKVLRRGYSYKANILSRTKLSVRAGATGEVGSCKVSDDPERIRQKLASPPRPAAAKGKPRGRTPDGAH